MGWLYHVRVAALAAALAVPGSGALASAYVPHLDIIGWSELEQDDRFSGLTVAGGLGQSVAVLDTGIDPEHASFDAQHSFFGDRIVAGEDFAGAPFADYADASTPYADGNRHGTFVTSVTAGNPLPFQVGGAGIELDGETFAAGTQMSISGVAPAAGLVPLRVLGNDASGTFADVRDGLQWVLDHHETHDIRVVNLSLGTRETFVDEGELTGSGPVVDELAALVDALQERHIPVIAATGNAFDEKAISFPAILPNVFAVGASRRDPSDLSSELIADFSNRGEKLDLVAPGYEIVGAYGRLSADDSTSAAGLANGTSFATPQVAGAVLLINEVFEARWDREPTYDELVEILRFTDTTALDTSTGIAYPRLDLHAALDYAYTIPEPGTVALLGLGGLMLVVRRRR